MVVSLKRVLVVVGLAFVAALHADGQRIESRVISSQRTSSATAAAVPRLSLFAARSLPPLTRNFGENDASRDNRKFLASSLLRETSTPFMKQSRFPVAEAFKARLQMGFVMASINHKNVMMGPLAPSQSTQAFVPAHSEDSYGFSFSVPLGRDAGSNGSQGLWRGVSRVLRRN
jgi:hypothetical protein